MTSQRKRLRSYLRAKGLEVPEADGAVDYILREEWGGPNVPDLMDRVLNRDNFNEAVRRVVANKGAPGVDGIATAELPDFVDEHWDEIYRQLRTGKYKPSPVRRVVIPKPDGGERNLGVPTVLDRAVQQAIAQVLSPIYEEKFSESSFGFRPNRSAHQAVSKLLSDYEDGYTWAVDLDLSKYFDTLNHDMLMNALKRTIHDETLLVTIKRFLKSGFMEDGVVHDTEEGSPQGGNLSPLLANIYLHRFDELLEERGHRFVRYADDIVILVRSRKAALRVMDKSAEFLEGVMKLKVNRDKSKVAPATEIKFLGFGLYDTTPRDGERKTGIRIHEKSIIRARERVKSILRENSNWTVGQCMKALTVYIRGWLGYFSIADANPAIRELAGWARRKLRAKLWHQWKTPRNRLRKLRDICGSTFRALAPMRYARSHGSWHMSAFRPLTAILTNRYLESLGFPKMLQMYEETHSRLANRRIREVRTVV